MTELSDKIQTIESYLDFLISAASRGMGNVPIKVETPDQEYKDKLNKIDYYRFIQSGDYHYFISRILYHFYIGSYSRFCGFQCIENYLKAYIKLKGQNPPQTHNLTKLLNVCKSLDKPNDSIIYSDKLPIIITMFEPFYELARYPIQKTKPKGGYAFLFPDDINILDYFVFKMREILPVPQSTMDILIDGHSDLINCQFNKPEFYKLFTIDNVNFIDAFFDKNKMKYIRAHDKQPRK